MGSDCISPLSLLIFLLFLDYSQEIITKISSLHSRLIFRRHLIRVYSFIGISIKD